VSQQTFIRLAQLASFPGKSGRIPVGPNTIWRWVREGKFPAPVSLGANVTAWRLSDVEAWEASREVAA
jgi:predicted DNA-binding transcriptional regulator AlpA